MGAGKVLRFSLTKALAGGLLFLAVSGSARASFVDDAAEFDRAVSILRAAIGGHARVLKVEVEPSGVTIEAQDPRNRSHVDRWRYGVVTFLRIIPLKRLSGPQAVEPQLVNPDLEANLFDFDSIDLAAAPKLMTAAIARAKLQDAAAVTRMEIERQIFILPKPTSGEVRWTIYISSGREHAEIRADVKGNIVGVDLSGTQRAKNLDLLKDPSLTADAAAAFRGAMGAGAVLTSVGVDTKTVSFGTNIRDTSLARLGTSLPATASFTWDLNGLQQRLGSIDVNAQMGKAGPPPFSVDDVNWTILPKLAQDALAKAAVPQGRVTHFTVGKSSEQPGGPVLAWTVQITDPQGEATSVIADAKGAIQRVVLPASRRPKTNWLDAATIAGTIGRVAATFGADAKVASIIFEEDRARITVEDAANGGRPATFDFSPDTLSRSIITFSLESTGPRFSVGDVTPLNAQKVAALEADAMKKLAGQRTVYLQSVSIGAHPFVRQAGARAIEIRVRDVPKDSAQANYAWIVFDFSGKVLDFVTF
jgi:hypothetical protein